MNHWLLKLLALLGLILLAACNSTSETAAISPTIVADARITSFPQVTAMVATRTVTAAVANSKPQIDQIEQADLAISRTYHRADGNRVVAGSGNFPALTSLDIPLSGKPTWVTAVPYEDGALWVVTLDDGRNQAYVVEGTSVTETVVTPQLPLGMPPQLIVQNGEARFIVPAANFSPLTHPVLINERGHLAYIDANGDIIIQKGEASFSLPVNALPDARILVDEIGRLLLLTDPTTDYPHGVLGDDLEARGISLIETEPAPRIINTIRIPAPHVIEGIAPIWADLNGDGQREIVVTRTSNDDGAQIVVFAEDGTMMAAGPAIGRGFRWRHQLAVAPFGPNGELELADVLTPHIGGIVEFYRWDGDTLTIVADKGGYTSHVIGTRNLDMIAAGDFDGSGRITLMLPNQARTELGGIQHTAEGAIVAWTLPVDGTVVTNVAVTALVGDRLAVGVGREDGVLRIWGP
jgi:hypothetical protein